MTKVEKYKALAYSLRNRAETADPSGQRKAILALAARFEALAIAAGQEEASEIVRLFEICSVG